ncbi:UDP-glucose 4-epimerase [hydrothermal vent metagenome]|uniref:UDP-glucose 4-epimerase n=1 Tax=hydrothermal vent metagenome TaxID=652676 RepID=A0A3B1BFF6_9ZZZZ
MSCEACPDPQDDWIMNQDIDRVLVTGAGGFVGRRLCQMLSDMGYKLRVLVRNDRYEEFFRLHNAEICTGDITDPEVPEWIMDGVCGVFHLASIVQEAGIPDAEFWDANYTATRRLLKAAVKNKVKKFVHCSTIGVMGHIANPPADEDAPLRAEDIYQITKAEGEKIALAYNGVGGMDVTVVRPSAIYGPGDTRLYKLFKMVAQEKFRMVGSGKTLIHPVYIDDLVPGMILAMESAKSAGRVYILGGEKAVTLNEWVAMISAETRGAVPKLHIPYLPVKLMAMLCEDICKPLRIEPPLFRRRVDFFVKNRAFSIARARAELGYEPKIGLRDGVHRTVAWYKKHGWI